MCEDPVTAMAPGSRDEAEFTLEHIHVSRDVLCACPAVSEFWAEGLGAGGVHTAKASRGESSFRGKGSAPGCIPKLVLPRPD